VGYGILLYSGLLMQRYFEDECAEQQVWHFPVFLEVHELVWW
jgi:hypothetical protein